MDDAKLGTLASVPLFSRSSRKELVYLASRVDEVRVEAWLSLTHQGKANHTFYVIVEGDVDVTVDQHALATLSSGDVLGEISMLHLVPATANAVTRTPVRLLAMSHRQFHDAIRGNPHLRSQLEITARARLAQNAGSACATHPRCEGGVR